MALNAQQVENLQNSTPTDWNKFDQQLQNMSNWDSNRFAMDKNLHVRFYMKPRLNPDRSAEANRAIYEDTEYVEIMIPGDKHNIIQRPVWEQDIVRFGELYNKFKAGQDQVIGTPLGVVPFLTPAQVEEFGFFNVKTVEQLANLNDGISGRFMGAHELKAKAKAWLDTATSGETLLRRIQELEAQLAARAEDKPQPEPRPAVAVKK